MQAKDREQRAQGPRRAAIYCRVSTDEQEENTSLDGQEDDCRRYAEEQGFIVVGVYREAYTGSLYRERKKLSALRELVRARRIDGVVVRTFDRLSRTQTHFAVLIDELQHYGVELLCVRERVDNSPMGQAARVIMSLFAEIEHEKITERTQEGRRRAVTDKGHINAGWKPLYGYSFDNPAPKMRHSVHVNEEEARIVRRAVADIASGIPLNEILRQLRAEGVPPPVTSWNTKKLLHFVHDERYIGKGAAFSKHDAAARRPLEPVAFAEGTYPPIVDAAVRERALAQLARNKEQSGKKTPYPEKFLLRAGLVRCGVCGRKMYAYLPYNRRPARYKCNGDNTNSLGSAPCTGQSINAEKLDAGVWEDIVTEVALDPRGLEKSIEEALQDNSLQREQEALAVSRRNAEAERAQYLLDLQSPHLRGPEHERARESVLGLLANTEGQLERLTQEEATLQTGAADIERVRAQYARLLAWCKNVEEHKDTLSYEEKRAFLEMLGVQVFVPKINRRNGAMRYSVRIYGQPVAEILRKSERHSDAQVLIWGQGNARGA